MSCHGCKKTLIGLSKFHHCASCKTALFCSRECWTKVKLYHKLVCSPFVDTIKEEYLRARYSSQQSSAHIGDTLTAEYTPEERDLRRDNEIPDFRPRRVNIGDGELDAANDALRKYATIFRDPIGDGSRFCLRFFRSMYVVADSTYAAFRKSFEASKRDRELALIRWARINMDPPPRNTNPGTLRKIEKEYRKQRTGTSDTEDDRILEFQINLFNKIDSVMGEMENMSNEDGGIKLSLDWDPGTRSWSDVNQTFLAQEGEPRRLWLSDLADRLETLASFIGLVDAKDAMIDLISSFLSEPSIFVDRHRNIMLWGNPGTGKTEVGKILGPIFYKMGFLASDPGEGFVEKTKADFVAPFAGQTTHKTKMLLVNNLGGFIFLDEAYDLVSGGKEDMGVEALNQIVAFLGTYKGMITMTMGGYEKDIRTNLMDKNPGLDSRFPDKWSFYPYNVTELYQIFIFMARKKRVSVKERPREIQEGSARETLYFGIESIYNLGGFENDNARGISNILNQAIRSVAKVNMIANLANALNAEFRRVGQVLYLNSDALFDAFKSYGRQKGIKVKRPQGLVGRGRRDLPQDPPGDDPTDEPENDDDQPPDFFRPRGIIPPRTERRREEGLGSPPPAREAGGVAERVRRQAPQLDPNLIDFDQEADFYSLNRISQEEEKWRQWKRNYGRLARALPGEESSAQIIREAQATAVEGASSLGKLIPDWEEIREWWRLALEIVEEGDWIWNTPKENFPPRLFNRGIRVLDNILNEALVALRSFQTWLDDYQSLLVFATQASVRRRQQLVSPRELITPPGRGRGRGRVSPVPFEEEEEEESSSVPTTPVSPSPFTEEDIDKMSGQRLKNEISARGGVPETGSGSTAKNRRTLKRLLGLFVN